MEILHVIVVGKFDKSDLVILKWDLREVVNKKKRIFYGQADRKG